MRILIIEDEVLASNRLKKLIAEMPLEHQILDVIDTVEDGIKWFQNFPMPDLVISDIQLADGLSFQIFDAVQLTCPVVFATAYDHYAIKAFKVNGIDYLLKPIVPEELSTAIGKAQSQLKTSQIDFEGLKSILQQQQQKVYKERFVTKSGEQLKFIASQDVIAFVYEDSYAHLITAEGKKHVVDFTMDQLAEIVDPKQYFRVNRQYYISTEAIKEIHSYFNSRLKIKLTFKGQETIVSRDKVAAFKAWLDR